MIELPSNLTIAERAGLNQPTAAQIAAFADVPSSFVADAMAGMGALDEQIKPLAGTTDRFHGPALTCWAGPADIRGVLASLAELRCGDVLAIATEGWRGCAVFGDRVVNMARIAGATALVTDGLVRDQAGIRAVGLPVFAAGASPNSPQSQGPGRVGLPIVLGGRPVASGDMVVGDEDGVVTVPFAQIDEVIAQLTVVQRLEKERDDELLREQCLPARIHALTSGPGVTRL